MKTILVPTQNTSAMKSTLETAVLLAQRTGAYIEGVPLWFGAPEFVVAELASMAVASVVATDRRETAGTGVTRALELLKQDVAALERLLPDAAE